MGVGDGGEAGQSGCSARPAAGPCPRSHPDPNSPGAAPPITQSTNDPNPHVAVPSPPENALPPARSCPQPNRGPVHSQRIIQMKKEIQDTHKSNPASPLPPGSTQTSPGASYSSPCGNVTLSPPELGKTPLRPRDC